MCVYIYIYIYIIIHNRNTNKTSDCFVAPPALRKLPGAPPKLAPPCCENRPYGQSANEESVNQESLTLIFWGIPQGPRSFHPSRFRICLSQTL